MSVSYEIWFTDSSGVRLAQLNKRMLLSDVLSFSCTKTANDLGALQMRLPESFDRNLLKRDNMIQIWRAPTGGRLSMFQAYFINRYRFAISRGEETVEVWGVGPSILLDWRRVAYFGGETQTDVQGVEADDLMKQVVRDNLVTVTAFEVGADTTEREWATVSVQGDLTLGPQLHKFFAWRQVIEVLQDASGDSQAKGNQVWFEMVPILGTNSISFEFRTSIGQPGQDLTGAGVVFSADKGTLRDVSLEYDYTQERTYVYSLGQGEGSDRNVQVASDATRIGESLYGRKETVANATIDENDDSVQSAADAELYAGRPRIRFSATPQDTDGFRFGRDWNFGDKMIAKFENREFIVIAKTVRIAMRNQQETVATRLEFES